MDTSDFGNLIGSLVRHHFRSCYRCRQDYLSSRTDAADWAIRHILLYPVGLLCPDCQSPSERAESTIRKSTGTFTFERGRLVQHPKLGSGDGEDSPHTRAS